MHAFRTLLLIAITALGAGVGCDKPGSASSGVPAPTDDAYYDVETFAAQAWQAEVGRIRGLLKEDPEDADLLLKLGQALSAQAGATPNAEKRNALRAEATEACLRSHAAAGGDYLTHPTSGRLISPEEARRVLEVAADGQVEGLPGVRREADGRFLRTEPGGQTVVAGGPGNVDALIGAGILAVNQGDHAVARGLLEKARRVQPYSYSVAAALAYLRGEADGEWEDAEKELRSLAYRPESRFQGDAWRWLACAYDRLNRPTEAVTACRRALQFMPDSCELRELLSRLDSSPPGSEGSPSIGTREKEGPAVYDPVQSKVSGLLRRGDVYGALEVCRGYLLRWPRSPVAWCDLGEIYGKVYRYPQAIAAMERARKLHPSRLQYQAMLGAYLTYAERFAEAEEILRGGLEQDAGYEHLHLTYASMLTHRGKPREAAESLKKYTQAVPMSIGGWLRLGDAYVDIQEYANAEVAYRNALRWDPRDAGILLRLARVYEHQNNRDRALDHYLQAVQSESAGGGAFMEMRQFVNRHGLYESLVSAVDELIEDQPTRPSRLYAGRAGARLMMGRYDEAEADYNRALNLVLPEDRPWLLMSRGVLHLLRGHDDAAVADLTQSMEQSETLLYPGLWLWIVHMRNDRPAEARQAVTEALDRGEWNLHGARLMRYYLDEIDRDVLLSLAEDEDQRCEIYFCIGARAMVEGRERESYDWYWKCAQTLVTDYYEYIMAVYYLRQARDAGRWTMPEGGDSPAAMGASAN